MVRMQTVRLLCLFTLLANPVLYGQSAALREAAPVQMPGRVDCNSSAHWHDGKMYLFNSSGLPVRSEGPDQFQLGQTRAVAFDHHERHSRWIEASWMDEEGILYAWYHHEPRGICEAKEYHPESQTHKLTAPKIGALRSENNGASFVDLGVILEAPPEVDCGAENGFFAGGNGDFSVMLDRGGKFLYFLFGSYSVDVSQQGVAVARMAYADRDKPVGKIWKYREGTWKEPGLGGCRHAHLQGSGGLDAGGCRCPLGTLGALEHPPPTIRDVAKSLLLHQGLAARGHLRQFQPRPGRSETVVRTPEHPARSEGGLPRRRLVSLDPGSEGGIPGRRTSWPVGWPDSTWVETPGGRLSSPRINPGSTFHGSTLRGRPE